MGGESRNRCYLLQTWPLELMIWPLWRWLHLSPVTPGLGASVKYPNCTTVPVKPCYVYTYLKQMFHTKKIIIISLLCGMHSNIFYLFNFKSRALNYFATHYRVVIWNLKNIAIGIKEVGCKTGKPGCDSWFYHLLPVSLGKFLSLPQP